MISIICLIYKSPRWAEFVYNSVMRYTPEIQTGEAEFYFIANDASPEVLQFLKEKEYPHHINNNEVWSEEKMFKMGYGRPEYISRVYRGYNFGIKMSKNPILVLINSDNTFSPNWLSNLKAKSTPELIVGTRVVQPYRFRSPMTGTFCEVLDCGRHMSNFNEQKFLNYANKISKNSTSPGNAFMPIMMHKEKVEEAGMYPEGNIHAGTFQKIHRFGDHDFMDRMEKIGVKHITVNNSIIYHFDEGEFRDKL